MMLTTVAPIPEEVLKSDTFHTDTLISRFIADIITDATPLIYTDITFKDQQAKFYKVRVDNELNPLKGLIVDSYTLIHRDTLYSFSYWRYDASELYDYSKQRMFFDMIRITAGSADSSSAPQPVTQPNTSSAPQQKSRYWLFIVIAIGIAGGAGYMYYRNQRW